MSEKPSWKSKFDHATPYLFFSCLAFAWGDILFGVDTGSFGSLQALPSWLRTFGQFEKGKYVLDPKRKSIMNSVTWVGKLLGTMVFEPMVERLGYKKVMYICATLQIIGIIIELTSKNWIVFSVGREFAYLAVGIVENAVPSYQAEVAPAPMRGLVAGSIMCVNMLGNTWGAGMSRAFATEARPRGWQIPTGIQIIPAVGVLLMVPFTPESPRWLVLKNKQEAAIKSLDRLRPKEDVLNGLTLLEVEALGQVIAEAKHWQGATSWFDLLRGTYLRRTVIISLLFFFQQTTGNQFIGSYGPTFFVQSGLGTKSFTYNIIALVMGAVGCACCLAVCDKVGRRPPLIIGLAMATVSNLIIAVCGSRPNPSTADINCVVAFLVLLSFSVRLSVGTLSYLYATEIGGVRMRKKIIAVGTAVDVLSAFAITFSFPYLLSAPYADLGAKVGYIMMGLAAAATVIAIFFVPELNGRSLEEVDELFERRLWAWEFKDAETHGIGHMLSQIEAGEVPVKAGEGIEVSHNDDATGERDVKHEIA